MRITGIVTSKADGMPIPGVTIAVFGTTIGTITDMDGRYVLSAPAGSTNLTFSFIGYETKVVAINNNPQINVTLTENQNQLNEVMVVGYGTLKKSILTGVTQNIPVSTVDNQTSVEFEIDVPYSIPSDGKSYVVNIRELSFPTLYQYYCVPKLDKEAFLMAKITKFEGSDISNGEANMYFEGTYLGKTELNFKNVTDTLVLSLGRDKNIKVSRKKLKETTGKQFLGGNKIDNRGYEISIKSLKKQAIDLIIEDQLPLTTSDEIKVEANGLDNGILNLNTGLILWHLQLAPAKDKKIVYKYAIKYPKEFKLQLDE
jgi:uncharacterized protein (TIGR02231 family)